MITFFTEDTSYSLKKKQLLKKWIKGVVEKEGAKVGDINIILCSDDYLLEINKQYLQHDYYTDIITFNYNTQIINGDLFISIDRVEENAEQHNVPRETELHRVMIHGVLHLLGYSDKTKKEAETIRTKENESLKMFHVE